METNKIVMMGLDNAGKTSILLSMMGKYDPSELRPTMGIERSEMQILGVPVSMWDFGGQKKYRKSYFETRTEMLAHIDQLFFVIDLTDSDRFLEALLYYVDIVNHLQGTGLNPPIVLFLHKADPDFINTSTCQASADYLTEKFTNRSKGFELEIYLTSVLNHESLVKAFSRSLVKKFALK